MIIYRLHWTYWNRLFPPLYVFSFIFISSRLPIAKSATSRIEAAVRLPLFQNSQCSFALLWPTAESSWVSQSHQIPVGFDSMLHLSCLGTKLFLKKNFPSFSGHCSVQIQTHGPIATSSEGKICDSGWVLVWDTFRNESSEGKYMSWGVGNYNYFKHVQKFNIESQSHFRL